MNIVDIHQTVKFALPVGDHEYSGQEDSCHFRNGDGQEIWQNEQWRQQYTGRFLQSCLHNYGTYTWKNIDTYVQHNYEGKFFANNLEGYGVLSYPDGQIYEGLFKSNRRYGPGVLTHPDGSQDVGLWEGNHLVRLNQLLPNKSVPLLAQSIQGKAYLLNFKSLVPVQEKTESTATKILTELGADETVLEKSDVLYSKYVRNTNSVFFNEKVYCDDYFNNDVDWTMKVVDTYDTDGVPVITQVLVSHLLAWNNENLAISFMKHAFRHRNHEKVLTYNVSNILTGQRYLFKDPGPQETSCIEFLKACCEEDSTIITKTICQKDLYPDVSDFQGNNSVIYAAAFDQTNAIKILTNFGANVDHLNDECLTALSMSILRYTAYKYDVTNWELAFLPQSIAQDVPPEVQEWRINNVITKEVDLEEKQQYLYDLSCVKPSEKKKGKKDKKEKKNMEESNTEGKKKKGKKGEEPQIVIDPKAEYLRKIFNTITCLLECGAHPNYGEAPFPPLILSLFARSSDIVEQLLKFGADTNIRTSYHLGSLTPLHIIASLPPTPELIIMAAYLLSNGADPNLAANTNHWEKEKRDILAGTEVEDYGKTPLQLLCMRYDFIDDPNDYLGDLCTLLINVGAEPNMYYLGHMPLTLAIIRGNIKLMQRILNSGLVDPNQGLGNYMGVPLTVLILRRYEGILPVNICEEVYNCLLDYYANPFNNVPGFEVNTIEFCLEENLVNEIAKTPKSAKSDKSIKSGKTEKSGKSGKSAKSGKDKGSKKIGHQQVIQLLYDAAETTLLERIQRKVVQSLYQYHIEYRFEDPIFDQIVKYTDVENTLKNLQILLDYKKIIPCKTFCYELLQYVSSRVKTKQPKQKKEKGKKVKVPPRTIDDMVEELDFSKSSDRKKKFAFKIYRPEIDPQESKFKVCFECYQKTNKILVLCPKCNLVYFCSQECNIKNMKKKSTKHPCNFLFYNDELQMMLERFERGEPMYQSNKFDGFNALRKKIIASTPNYLENIKNYDSIMTDARDFEKEMINKTKESSPAGRKRKSKGRSSRATSRSGRKGKRSPSDESGREGKTGKKGKGKSRDGSETSGEEGKGGKSGKKGKKGRDRSSDDGISKKKKGRPSKTDKSKETKDKNNIKSRETKRRQSSPSPDRHHKGRKQSLSPDGRRKTPGGDGRRKTPGGVGREDLSPNREKLSPDRGGFPQDRRGFPQDRDGYSGGDQLQLQDGRRFTGRMHSMDDQGQGREGRRGFITDELRDAISDICEVFDYKFFQMFTPYCIFIDGQLYYKFNNIDTFYKLTYSCV